MRTIRENVMAKIALASAKTNQDQAQKTKTLETFKTIISKSFPSSDLLNIIDLKMQKKANIYKDAITLRDLEIRILSNDVERFVLSMDKTKGKGIEAVASTRDKRVSFLKDGIFVSTYKFISPSVLKSV